MIKKNGFTLAEVLITLGIIGVVAALTIPALMNNTNDKQLKVAWKKAYTVLSQATISVLNDNDGTLKGLCSTNPNDCLRDAYLPYIKTIKICDQGQPGCFYGNGEMKLLSGAPFTGWGVDSSVVLPDGGMIDFYYPSPTCTNHDFGNLLPDCGYIGVDVNGNTKPNTVGKDIFFINILENGIKPYGSAGDGREADCITSPPTGDGVGCAAKYILGD